jgi:polysaccharide biosynthesis/export protein
VSVEHVNSKKYSITGAVNKPGTFPLVVPTRVFDVLIQAGGYREFADKKDIVIARGDWRINLNWDEVVEGKKLGQSIFLENGDAIIVKELRRVWLGHWFVWPHLLPARGGGGN